MMKKDRRTQGNKKGNVQGRKKGLKRKEGRKEGKEEGRKEGRVKMGSQLQYRGLAPVCRSGAGKRNQ